MRRWWLTSALLCGACFDFDQAAQVCRDSGRCESADGGGGEAADAGTLDGGAPDAGGADAGTLYAPIAFTSTGFAWDYPFPMGGGLTALAPVDDDELYAVGDDDVLVHYARGAWTVSHLPSPWDPPTTARCLLRFADGGLWAFDTSSSAYLSKPGGGFSVFTQAPPTAMEASRCALSDQGLPWIGGKKHDDPTPSIGPGIQEGVLAPRDVWYSPGPPSTAGFVRALDPSGLALVSDQRVLQRLADGGWTELANLGGGYYPAGAILRVDPSTAWVVGSDDSSFVVTLDGGVTRFPVPGPSSSFTGTWSSLLSDGPDVVIGGGPGVLRCPSADPSACTSEYGDPHRTLFALARGKSALFAVGWNGQILRKPPDAGWQALAPGARTHVYALWQDGDGTLWAGADDGWLLHRTASGWVERQLPGTGTIFGVTRTSGGTLWVAGDELLASVDDVGPVSATIERPDGGTFTLEPGSGASLNSIAGTEPGNTWAVGMKGLLLGWDGTTWRQVPVPPSVSFSEVWVSDGGTAWAVGGYNTRAVYFFDGAAWSDRTPTSASSKDLFTVWGAGPREVFVTGFENDGLHFLPDGGVKQWALGNGNFSVSSMTGRVRGDGGIELWGLMGDLVAHARGPLANATLTQLSTGVGYANLVRLYGDTLWVTGPRYDGNSGFVVSLDAGR